MFQRNPMPPPSGRKDSSPLKMEAENSSEPFIGIYQTARYHSSEHSNLHGFL
jgi:hypothetical protein